MKSGFINPTAHNKITTVNEPKKNNESGKITDHSIFHVNNGEFDQQVKQCFQHYVRINTNNLFLTGYKLRISVNKNMYLNYSAAIHHELQNIQYNFYNYKAIDFSLLNKSTTATLELEQLAPLTHDDDNDRFRNGAQLTIYACTENGVLTFKDIYHYAENIYLISKFLDNHAISHGKIPDSDMMFNTYFSGRYDGKTINNNYISDQDDIFINHIKQYQSTTVFFAAINAILNLKTYANKIGKSTFFKDSKIEESEVLNSFLSDLKNCHSFMEAKILITSNILFYKDDKHILFKSKNAHYYLDVLLKSLDRPELRELRDHANRLLKKEKDPLSVKKGVKLHQILDTLMDEANPEIVYRKLLEAAKYPDFNRVKTNANIFKSRSKLNCLLTMAAENINRRKALGIIPTPPRRRREKKLETLSIAL